MSPRRKIDDFLDANINGLRAVAESLNEGVGIADENGIICYANHRFFDLTGHTREEVIGKRMYEIFVPPDSNERTNVVARMRERYQARLRGISETYEMNVVRKDGECRTIEVRAAPLVDQDGDIIGSTGAITDITERKLMEEQLRWSHKMEAVGRLAGGVAHDFNNLLMVIQGYASVLKEQLSNQPELFRKAQVILESSEAASALTRQLLSISNRQVVQKQSLDLNELITESVHIIQGLLGERIKLQVNLQKELPLTTGDVSQLQQVLLNLVVNSRDAMPEGGAVRITTELVKRDGHAVTRPAALIGAFVCLRVEDTGHGMSDEVRARIFEPFFSTKKNGHSSGLGLAITFGIVSEHSGEIHVRSEPGRGSTFEILFPATAERAPRKETAEEHLSLSGSEVVLLAEDQPAVRGLLKETLQNFGYTVIEAVDGADALRLAMSSKGKNIDLLLTDLVMPVKNGLELAGELLSARPHLKVVVVSGYPDDPDVWNKIQELKCAFLAKPFSPNVLARVVRHVLDGDPPDRFLDRSGDDVTSGSGEPLVSNL